MQIGMVGLGRMGNLLARRLMAGGHECVVFDLDPAAIEQLEEHGAVGARSLEDFAEKLTPPRTGWIMVPAAVTEKTVRGLAAVMQKGDTIIDGGNSYYRDDIHRAEMLLEKGIHYLDIGTSGGVHGFERGFCLMIGGEKHVVERLEPIFSCIAPGVGAALRTPGRTGALEAAEEGFLHCGPSGAGHFVKMVHNGIEYGIMAAYAEGLNILQHANIGATPQEDDSETAPMRDARYYNYNFDLKAVTEVWRRGSVISSWLLDLTAIALTKSPTLEEFAGRVSDSGEGRWTVLAAVDEGVPANVLSAALYSRFRSRIEADFADKVLSAMREQFGGHSEKPSVGV
ncbi:MAG: phosphogluconate dehydrogenase (NAD(+)-dependent, decarboxylating) [Solirubrobacteraceae bacterium]